MVTYQQEFLSTCKEDCQELIRLHWEEIAVNKEKIKLNPDWDAYQTLEDANALRIFTARDKGKLVGYFVVLISRNLHYKDHLFADNDIIYLHKDYRKGFTGVKLIKFVEKCLKQDGISVLKINTKVHQPFDQLMSYLKFGLIERVYTKYLGD